MKFSLGTAQFGGNYGISNLTGKPNLLEIKKILIHAKKKKVKFLDLAEDYKGVIRVLGKLNINNFKIVLKLKIKSLDSQKKIINNFNKSLKLLKLKKIHAVLIHNIKDFKFEELKNFFKAFKYLKKKGLITKFGVSCYNMTEAKKIIKNYKITFIQIPLNIFDQDFLKKKNYQYLKKKKIEVHVRSIFLQGLLLMKKKELPFYFKKWEYLFNNFEKKKIITKKNSFELCINFIKKNFKKFESVVIGINSAKELDEIINMFEKKIYKTSYKNLSCVDKKLIYPFNWKNKS